MSPSPVNTYFLNTRAGIKHTLVTDGAWKTRHRRRLSASGRPEDPPSRGPGSSPSPPAARRGNGPPSRQGSRREGGAETPSAAPAGPSATRPPGAESRDSSYRRAPGTGSAQAERPPEGGGGPAAPPRQPPPRPRPAERRPRRDSEPTAAVPGGAAGGPGAAERARRPAAAAKRRRRLPRRFLQPGRRCAERVCLGPPRRLARGRAAAALLTREMVVVAAILSTPSAVGAGLSRELGGARDTGNSREPAGGGGWENVSRELGGGRHVTEGRAARLALASPRRAGAGRRGPDGGDRGRTTSALYLRVSRGSVSAGGVPWPR